MYVYMGSIVIICKYYYVYGLECMHKVCMYVYVGVHVCVRIHVWVFSMYLYLFVWVGRVLQHFGFVR